MILGFKISIVDIDNYRVEKIKNHSFLAYVIKFLKEGYNETDLFAYKYLDYLLTMNLDSNVDPFGYALFKKDELEGAILTVFQGHFIKNESN